MGVGQHTLNIIVLTKAWKSPLNIRLTKPRIFVTIAALLLFPAAAVYVGYVLGGLSGEQKNALLGVTSAQAVPASKTQSLVGPERIDALSTRIAELQAHIIRLDALGERLVEIAKLDKREFDFGKIPASGGPEFPVYLEPSHRPDIPGLLNTIDELSSELEDKGQKLSALENLLIERNLQEEVIPSGWPISGGGGWISSLYGRRIDPFSRRWAFHYGMDFAGREGSRVIAVGSGIVTWSGERYGYGKLVEVDHGHGYVTRYGHNKKNLVKVGDVVRKGQALALMGSSGRSTGPHVHFELVRNGKPINPSMYISQVR